MNDFRPLLDDQDVRVRQQEIARAHRPARFTRTSATRRHRVSRLLRATADRLDS